MLVMHKMIWNDRTLKIFSPFFRAKEKENIPNADEYGTGRGADH